MSYVSSTFFFRCCFYFFFLPEVARLNFNSTLRRKLFSCFIWEESYSSLCQRFLLTKETFHCIELNVYCFSVSPWKAVCLLARYSNFQASGHFEWTLLYTCGTNRNSPSIANINNLMLSKTFGELFFLSPLLSKLIKIQSCDIIDFFFTSQNEDIKKKECIRKFLCL